VRSCFVFTKKKCRNHAGFGVSQIPKEPYCVKGEYFVDHPALATVGADNIKNALAI
jgi:hypothetical protein